MVVTIEYWNPKNETVVTDDGFRYRDTTSIVERTEVIEGNKYKIFKEFYKKNNSLRYCNGSHYKFQDKEIEKKYNLWYRSLNENTKFQMYYGNGVVD